MTKFTADGILTGATISLQENAAQEWIAGIIAQGGGPPAASTDAHENLIRRQQQIKESLESDQLEYTPVLRITDRGEPDLSEWATGFLEAIGDEIALWTYSLADTREKLLFALIGAHVVGPAGDAAREFLKRLPNQEPLQKMIGTYWEAIPALLEYLYRKKTELAPLLS
nr:UPF0149 family protein [Novosphingobium profundi]